MINFSSKKNYFDYKDWDEEVKKFNKVAQKKIASSVGIQDNVIINKRASEDNIEDKSSLDDNFVLGSFDRRTLKKIKNNKITIERTLDLHNLIENEARVRFFTFIKQCYIANLRYLLIITGKGKNSNKVGNLEKEINDIKINRGILYQNFFHWVEDVNIKRYIISYSKANNNHGGSGAFYVLIRNNKNDKS